MIEAKAPYQKAQAPAAAASLETTQLDFATELWNHATRAFWRYTEDAAVDADVKRFKGIL